MSAYHHQLTLHLLTSPQAPWILSLGSTPGPSKVSEGSLSVPAGTSSVCAICYGPGQSGSLQSEARFSLTFSTASLVMLPLHGSDSRVPLPPPLLFPHTSTLCCSPLLVVTFSEWRTGWGLGASSSLTGGIYLLSTCSWKEGRLQRKTKPSSSWG